MHRRRPRHADGRCRGSLLRHGHISCLLQARPRWHAPLGLSQSGPQVSAAAQRRSVRDRQAACRGVGWRHLQLGTRGRWCRLLRGHRRLDVLPRCAHRRRAVEGRQPCPVVPRRPLEQPADGLADSGRTTRSIFGGGTLEQLFAGSGYYAGSTGRGFLVALDPARARSSGSTTSAPSPRSSIRRSSSKSRGASTSSTTVRRRAASGQRRPTITKPTRSSSAPT